MAEEKTLLKRVEATKEIMFRSMDVRYSADETRKRIQWDSREVTEGEIAQELEAATVVKDAAEPNPVPKIEKLPKHDGREDGYTADYPPPFDDAAV